MLASIVLLVGAGPVPAAFLFSEDYETYNLGVLPPQGGWTQLSGGYENVANGTGVNTTKTSGWLDIVVAPSLKQSSLAKTFTAADPDTVFSSQFLTGSAIDGDHYLANYFGTTAPEEIGLQIDNNNFIFRDAAAGNAVVGNLAPSNWYEMKWVVDWSVAGGEGDASHRNLTTGGPWVDVPSLQNHNMQLTNFSFDYVRTYMGKRGVGLARDNIYIYDIPEPGSLALLATGLIGLLCYARRKRG